MTCNLEPSEGTFFWDVWTYLLRSHRENPGYPHLMLNCQLRVSAFVAPIHYIVVSWSETSLERSAYIYLSKSTCVCICSVATYLLHACGKLWVLAKEKSTPAVESDGSDRSSSCWFHSPGLIPMRICSKVPAGQPTRTTGPLRLLPRRPPCARFTSRFGVVLLHGSKQPPLAGGCCCRSKGWENRAPAVSRFSPRDRLCTAARNRPCPRWQHSTPTHHKPSCWLLRHLVRRVSSSTSRNAFFFVSECEKKDDA